ncbi:twin-arginine translocase subunit TatB [Phreatobacter aquaticus]|uniref:Sec-independent protein translocase protein TatB n=1 Tax=Phreatobacter aquaticus TaxID=2570229 RepID=A0A4D7QL21_9HYPH|nr:Sec-independent protein translocase protein TatB [Phreatobacter aquaticus]QCK87281.1 twin-arginine translocase subunit TatB [Phreatobacter aquaticus]
MFDLSWGEIALIGVVALVVIGPKELPGVLRGLGQALTKLRRMASDFQYQFNQALQEAEVDKVKSSLSSVTDSVSTTTPAFNPIDYAREQIKSAVDDVKGTTTPAPAAPSANLVGPVTPDVAAQIPVPPSYSADPNSIQNAFSTPVTPPAPPPVVESPAEPEPKKQRSRAKAAPAESAPPESIPAAVEPEPAPVKPKRARKTAE